MRKGFTLIELLIVISILTILAVSTFLGYNYFKQGSQLRSTGEEMISAIRTAQSHTLASLDSSNYGVHFEADQFILFKGDIYNPVSPDNQVYELSGILEIYDIMLNGGGSDVVFEKLTGNTDEYGTVSLRIKNSSRSYTATIESSGTASIQ